MKILQINSFFTVGGPPRIMNGIYDTLRSGGYDCKIAASREKMYVPVDSIQICSNFAIKLNAIKARLFDNEGFNAKLSTKKLIEQIESYNPDIIHLQNIHGYYLNSEILFEYLKRKGKPVVWTLHDCWAFTGHCAYFDYAECDKWKTGCDQCGCKSNYPKSQLFNRSHMNFQKKKSVFLGVKNLTIVTPSRWLAQLVEQSFLSEYPVRVINNGIDTNIFKPIKNGIKGKYGIEDKYLILGVAQVWDKRKGLEYFIQLKEKLSDRYKIILVGLDDKQINSLPKGIIGMKKTSSVEELVELYSAADVFINPTLEDNYPTTNIEAIACGTPVITFPTGGSPETIEMSQMGIVTEGKNVESLVAAIDTLLSRTDHIDFDAKYYDSYCCYQKYIDLYKELIHEN